MTELWSGLGTVVEEQQAELTKLRRIRDIALQNVSRFVITCKTGCGHLAELEAGDWSGSSFYCRPCYEAQLKRYEDVKVCLVGPDVEFGPVRQNENMLELYRLLRDEA